MFEGFELTMIDTGEAVIRTRHGGSGVPLLLLHGHPQTHVMWHKIAPRLAQDFTVLLPPIYAVTETAANRPQRLTLNLIPKGHRRATKSR